MNEYLLLIRTDGDYCEAMSQQEHKSHLQKVGDYIQNLTKQGKINIPEILKLPK